MRVRIRVYLVCFCLGSKYAPNTQLNTNLFFGGCYPLPLKTRLARAMPAKTANPNPDRARRAASGAPAAEARSDEDSEDSGDEREGDEQEVALSEAAILRRMA